MTTPPLFALARQMVISLSIHPPSNHHGTHPTPPHPPPSPPTDADPEPSHALVNRPNVQRSSLHSHAARFNSTSTRSYPTSSHSTSSRSQGTGAAASSPTVPSNMETTRSPTPPQNPIPRTHHHDDIHPEDQPGRESFLPYTQIIYDELRDGAREGDPPELAPVVGQARGTWLSDIRSVGSVYSDAGPRYSQLDPNPRPITPLANDGAPIRYALNQITRDEDDRHARQYPVELGLGREQEAADRERLLGEDADPMTPAARYDQTGYPGHTLAPVVSPGIQVVKNYETPHGGHPTTALPPTPDTIIPYEHEEPPLNFLPGILRPLWLGIYIFLILLVLAGLLFSGIYSAYNDGLAQYIALGGSRWFVFKYLPTLLGVILLLWLFQIQIAVQRIAPFMGMTSTNPASRAEAPFMEVQPTGFLLPKTAYFKAKQPIIGICMILFWLQIFTIPLIACLYNVYYYGNIATPNWRWTAVQGIVWTLFAVFLLQLVALILLAVSLWRKRTGLIWDPRSLAEHVALLDRSNISNDYEGSESLANTNAFRDHIGALTHSHKLGYWTTTHRPQDFWYGIAREGDSARQYSDFGRANLHEKKDRFAPRTSSSTSRNGRSHASHFSIVSRRGKEVTNLEKGDEDYAVRVRYLPWFMKPAFALIWVILALALFLAFIIVSFVNNAVLYGFVPRLPVLPNAAGFASSNFFYSFIPTLLATLLLLGWTSVDQAYRRLQPYAALNTSSTTGAHAQDSMLLDYPYQLPILCTLAALLSGHYLVAWFSFITLITATFPVLAGGVFWTQFYIPQQEVRVSVETRGYYALCVFLAIAAFSAPLVLFTSKPRRLPHPVTTLAEQFSFLYASPLLGERGGQEGSGSRMSVSHNNAKTEMATRLLASHTKREAEADGGRFVLGRLQGRDGRMHLGIDRIGREGGKKGGADAGMTRLRTPSTREGLGGYDGAYDRPYTPTAVTTIGNVRYDPTYIPGRGSPNAFALLQQQQQQQQAQQGQNSPTHPRAGDIGLATSTNANHISPTITSTSTNTQASTSPPRHQGQQQNQNQYYYQQYASERASQQQAAPPHSYNKYTPSTSTASASVIAPGRSHNTTMGRDERRQEGAIASQLQFGRASGEWRGSANAGMAGVSPQKKKKKEREEEERGMLGGLRGLRRVRSGGNAVL